MGSWHTEYVLRGSALSLEAWLDTDRCVSSRAYPRRNDGKLLIHSRYDTWRSSQRTDREGSSRDVCRLHYNHQMLEHGFQVRPTSVAIPAFQVAFLRRQVAK